MAPKGNRKNASPAPAGRAAASSGGSAAVGDLNASVMATLLSRTSAQLPPNELGSKLVSLVFSGPKAAKASSKGDRPASSDSATVVTTNSLADRPSEFKTHLPAAVRAQALVHCLQFIRENQFGPEPALEAFGLIADALRLISGEDDKEQTDVDRKEQPAGGTGADRSSELADALLNLVEKRGEAAVRDGTLSLEQFGMLLRYFQRSFVQHARLYAFHARFPQHKVVRRYPVALQLPCVVPALSDSRWEDEEAVRKAQHEAEQRREQEILLKVDVENAVSAAGGDAATADAIHATILEKAQEAAAAVKLEALGQAEESENTPRTGQTGSSAQGTGAAAKGRIKKRG
jgi:hypothetical protein